MEKHCILKDVLRIIDSLDISPSMFKNATEKYRAVSEYLDEHGIDADFYPQGSFRLGTIVRPFLNGQETDYDLDVICELIDEKRHQTPKEVKESVGSVLECSAIYGAILLPEDDRCWTLSYAEINGVGFKLDIVPSVHEDEMNIQIIVNKGVDEVYADKAVSITERVKERGYKWVASNPKGYGEWFDDINRPYLESTKLMHRERILRDSKHVYASIEEIPEGLDRSALQRVIQILKRHRDIYYYVANGWDYRPISAIVTTLVAEIALKITPTDDVIELLTSISSALNQYSDLLTTGKIGAQYIQDTLITKSEENGWRIANPVNPDDNFADYWTNKHAVMFAGWISAFLRDIQQLSSSNDLIHYYTTLKTGFGKQIVERVFPESKETPITVISNTTKPWSV